MDHSWKRCRVGGCGGCCHCGGDCRCTDDWMTVQDLKDQIENLDPNSRIVFRTKNSGFLFEEDLSFNVCFTGPVAVEYNSNSITYRENIRGYEAPSGYEESHVLEMIK